MTTAPPATATATTTSKPALLGATLVPTSAADSTTTPDDKIEGSDEKSVTDTVTTVKPRPKKSQKSRDKNRKKAHPAPPHPDSPIVHIGDVLASDETVKRSRRFLETIIAQQHSFRHKLSEHFIHNANALPLLMYSVDLNYPPTRVASNLRRICRNECELLENELCQKEYAIAKRHPAIGQVLPIEDCSSLPDETNDCSSLGIAIDVDEQEDCYWENGSKYRGTIAVSKSGKRCLTWVRLMKEIADYPELAGQNYCR